MVKGGDRLQGGSPGWVRAGQSALIIAVLAFAVLALGAVHVWTRLVVSIGVCGLLTLTLYERMAGGRPLRLAAPLWPLALAALATALQLVPVPSWLLSVVSPTAHETLDKTLGGYGWHSLSLDWPATLSELGKILLYAAFFVAAVQYASRGPRRRRLAQAIAIIASAAALIGFAQALVDSERLLFFYKPSALAPALARGTFVNPNHFGALLCLALPCGLALALSEHRRRLVSFAAVCVMNLALILTLSRGAIVAGFVGQALVLFLLRRSKSSAGAERKGRVALVVAFAGTVVAGVIGFSTFVPEVASTVSDDSFASSELKLQAWDQATVLVAEYPVTGVGRGAFEQAFTRVSRFGEQVRFPWVENGYFQSVIDWGIPVAVLLFGLGIWVAVLAFRQLGRDPIKMAAFAGLVSLAAHEFVDFSVEIPGVALPALACLAVIFAGKADEKGGSGRRASGTLFALPVLLVTVMGLSMAAPLAGQDRETLASVARDPSVPVDIVIKRGEAARRRHPADYFVHLLVAERLARERHPETMRWLSNAMFLNPPYAPAHLMAAEILAASGRKAQALIEYRLAAENTLRPHNVWDQVARRYPALEDLLKATPTRVDRLRSLGNWLGRNKRTGESDTVHRQILQLQPDNVEARRQLVLAALVRRDFDVARRRLAKLMRVDQSEAAWAIMARERLMSGDTDAAMTVIDTRLKTNSLKFDLELALAGLLSARARYEEARARLTNLRQHTKLSREQSARVYDMGARIEKRAGNLHQHRWELEQAQRLREQ